MASSQRQVSSDLGFGLGPGIVAIDEQKRMNDPIGQVIQPHIANRELMSRINVTMQSYVKVESRNNVLRAQVMELTDRLRSLNSVLQNVGEVSGLALDIPETPRAPDETAVAGPSSNSTHISKC